MLIVSDRIPDVRSTGPRRRAWQMVAAATTRHAVTLVLQGDGPIHLAQWRRLGATGAQVHIVPSRTAMRTAVANVAATAPTAAVALSADVWPIIAGLDVPRLVDVTAPPRPSGPALRWLEPVRRAHALRREMAAAAACDLLVVEDRDSRARFDDAGDRMHVVPPDDPSAWLTVLDRLIAGPRLARIDGDITRRAAA